MGDGWRVGVRGCVAMGEKFFLCVHNKAVFAALWGVGYYNIKKNISDENNTVH